MRYPKFIHNQFRQQIVKLAEICQLKWKMEMGASDGFSILCVGESFIAPDALDHDKPKLNQVSGEGTLTKHSLRGSSCTM